jgi:hypothetical protein
MKPSDLVAQKAGEEQERAALRVPDAVATFRKSVDSSSPASAVSDALATAISTITPFSRIGYDGVHAANSNHADWHILRQILTEGPSYIYLTPESINDVEDTESCSAELLSFLTKHRLVIPVLQRRNPEDWADWEPKTPAHLNILETAIAPGEANDALLSGLLPNARERREKLRRDLSKFENVTNPRKVFFEFPTFNIDQILTSIAFRVALLGAIGRPSVHRYDDIISDPKLRDRHPRELHDGTMFEYRTICGRAFTSFGGSFMTLGWTWDRIVSMFAPALAKEVIPLRGDPQEMIISFEESLKIVPQRFNSIDWEVARDTSNAKSIITALELMMKDSYWKDLGMIRKKQNDMEHDLNARSPLFFDRLVEFQDQFPKYNEIRARALEPLKSLPDAGPSPASVSLATGEAIGLSEVGATGGIIRPELDEGSSHLVASEIVSLFEDCKANIRVTRNAMLAATNQ